MRQAVPLDVAASSDNDAEIVVTAARRGEAKVAAESEFDAEEIAGQGADSIQELLIRLAPFIDDSGEEPVILINGKPVGLDRSILSYPAEALERLAVLKPGASAHYGGTAGNRVVNLVLKQSFSMVNADASANFATAGGQYGGSFSTGRTAIRGETRWNAVARVGGDSALRKNARNIPGREGTFDSIGFVSGVNGAEIDPALSLAVGRAAMVAAIPPAALLGPPSLDDFAATVDIVHPVDPNRFETLRPSRRAASLNIGVTRPIGGFSASLNVNANRTDTAEKRGLPMISVILPGAHSHSPFAGNVMLTRPLAGERSLRMRNDSTSFGMSLTVNGVIGDWQTSLAVGYSRNWADSLLEYAADTEQIQHRIESNDPDLNPFAAWDDDLLIATRQRTQGENMSSRLNVRKTLAHLPAGPIVWSVTANANRNRSRSREEGDVRGETRSVARQQMNAQMALSLPILRRGGGSLGWLGELSIDLSASAEKMTGSQLQKQFAGHIGWSPWPILQLRGSIDHAETFPSFDQLDAPVVTTVNRIFDYARLEVAEPIWITGGNPDLLRGSRQSLALSAQVRPLGDQRLTLNLGYRKSVAEGGVAPFPELTPAIEAAFPDRVRRDADGRLFAIDARAINISRDADAELSSRIALRLGQVPPQRRNGTPADPVQFSLSINHRWRLKSELLTRVEIDVIDRLRDGGLSRHGVLMQASIGRQGIGASLNGNWSSPARLRGGFGDGDTTLRLKPPLAFNFSAFMEPGYLFARMRQDGLMKDLKISIDVQNLLNGYRQVTLEDGRVPPGYTRDEIDPVGRTLRLTMRKRF
ncbi:hypothetical protein L6Q21_03925 [Sandaracinobacter sp. RS1-74]|uniref:TonB-dependent receptor n=1 Tax=Sandaracinobacteroides sayramensis TaxID=2913411 RepID=UPI001EDB0F64|nr:hypothetical protein [Sandaracinobacteroides sayramensis]MCG2840133.1 hypothetical protein [Sandaracinobacteroides sayramensis]